jgi:hypothetical protein
MSLNTTGSDWTFYLVGAMMVVLGVSFILIPLLARSGTFSNIKIPWILLYTYNKNGFFFATSPILIIVSIAGILLSILRR